MTEFYRYDSFSSDSEASQASRSVMSVTQAMQTAKGLLESRVFHLIGEVSEVNAKPGYKAVYFSVKDLQSSLPCMMWLNRYQASGVKIRQGLRVEITGKFSIYVPKGRMNFDVMTIKEAGEGDLRKKVADLAKKLQAEGLTHPQNKKPLPFYPSSIGVVTSPRGAAVHDVMRTLRRRYPLATLRVAGVPVEGQTAPAQMIEALRCLVRSDCEVILLVRGGGSFEDLMPFNDEKLARAIFACPVPVVTGIGHEPDTTIADMVSDKRASTPTAAAESVAPALSEVASELRAKQQILSGCISKVINQHRLLVNQRESRACLSDPQRLYSNEAQTIDLLQGRLMRAIPTNLMKDYARCDAYRTQLRGIGLRLVNPFSHQLVLKAGRLDDLSPLSILRRGYSVTKTTDGAVVSHVDDVHVSQDVVISVSDGEIMCQVSQIIKGEK